MAVVSGSPAMKNLLFFLSVCLAASGLRAQSNRFAFVIPGDDAAANATDFSWLNARPAGAGGFVTIKDGRFHAGGERLRIWGVNTCFGANFPSHEDAEKVAARLAKLGLNGVRFHHHESAPVPRGILQPPRDGRRELDPEMLDRQDYFIDQLARRGIYANLNLHVGRTFTPAEGFPDVWHDREFHYNKFMLYFDPEMRVRFKEFCRGYLGRMNPYRKLSRANDPAVAVVEITNENSFSTKGPALARRLPGPSRDKFVHQWNAWLRKKYGTDDALAAAWKEGLEPPGAILARLDGSGESFKAWKLHQSLACPLSATPAQPGLDGQADAVHIRIGKAAAAVQEHELLLAGLTLRKDRTYTLSFAARAERERRLSATVSRQGPGDWSSLGYAEELRLGTEWERVTATFRATQDADKGARICFKFGGSDAGFWLAGLTLREGGVEKPLREGETLAAASIDIPGGGWPAPALADVRQFMVETEEGFIRDLVRFLKEDLGVKCPVTASQISYHTPSVLFDTCDYTDIHAYWQHPRFPGKPWDSRNWTIPNTPMEADIERNVLFERAAWRLFDRPFTMSEWDIPAPSDYAASTAPFAALTASLQDWDGVFFFTYASDANGYYSDKIGGYFTFAGHPAQLALLGPFGAMYRRGDLPSLTTRFGGPPAARPPPWLAMDRLIGIDPNRASPEPAAPAATARLASPGEKAIWDATDRKRAFVSINTPATRAVWGLIADREFELGGLRLRVGGTERNYAAVVCTSLDGKPVEQSGRLLLVAVGSAENQGMTWNETRTSVGNAWGQGPTLVNGIPIEIALAAGVKAVHPLDGRGARRADGPVVTSEAGVSRWQVGPEFQTLWYEIARE